MAARVEPRRVQAAHHPLRYFLAKIGSAPMVTHDVEQDIERGVVEFTIASRCKCE